MRQLRIACLGDYSRYFSWYLHGVMQGSILNGYWFRPIDIKQNVETIEENLRYFKPHYVFTHMILGEHINTYSGVRERDIFFNFLKQMKSILGFKILHQEGDPRGSRYEFSIKDVVDLVLLNNKDFDKFKFWDVPCIHWPYFSMLQDEIHPGDNRVSCQIAFGGNVVGDRTIEHVHYGRYEFIEKLKEKFNVKIFPDDIIGNSRFFTPEVAATAKSVLGIHQGFNLHGYLDTRPFQYCGAGALYFHDKNDAIDQFFQEGVHFVQYGRFNIDSFTEKFNYYQENREANKTIRRQAFEYCQKHHNSKIRVKQAIDVIEGKKTYPLYIGELI